MREWFMRTIITSYLPSLWQIDLCRRPSHRRGPGLDFQLLGHLFAELEQPGLFRFAAGAFEAGKLRPRVALQQLGPFGERERDLQRIGLAVDLAHFRHGREIAAI